MPGMGKTLAADWITHQDQMLEILLNFIDTVIPGQRFVVAGTSYGGYLARGLVYYRAAMMDGIFLMIPVIKADQANRNLPPHVTLVKDEALISELEPDEAEFFQEFAVVQSRELLDRLRTDVFPAFEIADHDFLDKVNYKFSFNVDALPQPFSKPTLILLGRQDPDVGYADAWDILENYSRASFVVLDRAGHGLGEEQKALFKALANEWLARVEESTD
jgi:pimeloyl-ACP methyl ester carboxylesterase